MIKKWLPLMIILAGIVITAIGVWQIAEGKMKTNETLSNAKRMLAIIEILEQYTDEEHELSVSEIIETLRVFYDKGASIY